MNKQMNKYRMMIVFLLFAVAKISAQEKYEYLNISWASWNNSKLSISTNGTGFTEEKIELPKGESSIFNTNPLFQKINEYQNQNWEIITINSYPVGTSMCHIAYLRKKK